MFSLVAHSDGIWELRIDRAGMAHNVMDGTVVAQLGKVVDRIGSDKAISAVIVSSAKSTFVAGGDLQEILGVSTEAEAQALVADNCRHLRRLETSNKPIVALINGPALGGGLELALACTYRIGANAPSVVLGLPEVGLGLMPGAGGTQRLPYLVGTETAVRMAVGGKPISVAEAAECGLVDEVVDAGMLFQAGVDAIRRGVVPPSQPWDRGRYTGVLPDVATPEGRAALGGFAKLVAPRAVQNDPTPKAIVDAMRDGLATDMDTALGIEQKHFARIASGKVAKAKIRSLFFGIKAAKSMPMRPADIPSYQIKKVGVIGAGLMGSGIAHVSAGAGFAVALLDVSEKAAADGKSRIAKSCEKAVSKGRMTQGSADALLEKITPTADYAALTDADFIVEAVSEDRRVKDLVLGKAVAVVRPGVPLATNTSTLPITGLAAAVPRPEDVVGLHFFAPVDRMDLVELIRGEATSQQTLARALDFVKALKKAVIVVRDSLGFYTSRVVGAYTGEALTLLAEGVPPEAIDSAAIATGMPLGPLAMADMTALPLIKELTASIQGDGMRQGLRGMRATEALERLVSTYGRVGRLGGKGIYDYQDGKPVSWPGLAECFPPQAGPLPTEVIEKRLIYSQVLEAARLLEEGIVASPNDANVGSLLAWAFPAWTGGVANYVDMVGAAKFVAECDALEAEFGGRFHAPENLRRAAARGALFNPL